MSTLNGTKQSIKRLELPISKFNDVAIPHHLDLLKKHKHNINKVGTRIKSIVIKLILLF